MRKKYGILIAILLVSFILIFVLIGRLSNKNVNEKEEREKKTELVKEKQSTSRTIETEGFEMLESYIASEKYSEKLSKRKQIIVANKIDVIQDEKLLKQVEELAKKENLKLFKVSAVTKQGIQELIDYVTEELKQLPKEELVEI